MLISKECLIDDELGLYIHLGDVMYVYDGYEPALFR